MTDNLTAFFYPAVETVNLSLQAGYFTLGFVQLTGGFFDAGLHALGCSFQVFLGFLNDFQKAGSIEHDAELESGRGKICHSSLKVQHGLEPVIGVFDVHKYHTVLD